LKRYKNWNNSNLFLRIINFFLFFSSILIICWSTICILFSRFLWLDPLPGYTTFVIHRWEKLFSDKSEITSTLGIKFLPACNEMMEDQNPLTKCWLTKCWFFTREPANIISLPNLTYCNLLLNSHNQNISQNIFGNFYIDKNNFDVIQRPQQF
jgi:hypothetical protein